MGLADDLVNSAPRKAPRRQAAAKTSRDPIRVVRFSFRVTSWFVGFDN